MNKEIKTTEIKNIAFLGNYLPRKCGIATFTTDICEAVASVGKDEYNCFAVAMNDVPEGYAYPDVVNFEIRQNVLRDYALAADFLNINNANVLCVQHEYGIFGGESGSYLLTLLRNLKEPVVTTLHTVLKEPTTEQKRVMAELAQISDRLIVMSEQAMHILKQVYDIHEDKVRLIHHGIPDVPFVDPNFYKDYFGVEGRPVILTFGLLSPNKGIEYAIDAMGKVIETHPEAVYIVLGATHPHVKKTFGEAYRNSLIRQVEELGLTDNIIFQNRFVSLQDLCEFLGAADLYVTPYLNPAQIVSGTLAYALGAGKAVVSTPYWYAEEMMAEGRGRLVPFKDSDAIAEQICHLLENEVERHSMRKKAYNKGRSMIWKEVAGQYMSVFDEVQRERNVQPRPMVTLSRAERMFDELPEIDLRHLKTLTDDTGMFQHSVYCSPNRHHGYTTDDNARALVASVLYWDLTRDESILPYINNYLSFLHYAFDSETKRFRNFMAYDRRWLEDIGSEESHARAMWGLAEVVSLGPTDQFKSLAAALFHEASPSVESFTAPRAWASSLVAIHSYLRQFGGDSCARRLREDLANRLMESFQEYTKPDWVWCEDILTYCNARVPQALLLSGQWMQRGDIVDTGLQSLEWLLSVQKEPNGNFSFIGNHGWFRRDEEKARFDQQPIEAVTTIDACIEAFNCTGDEKWLSEARRAFQWFLGRNDLRLPLYDFRTGGCKDGLQGDRINQNQGAESLLAWLISLLRMYKIKGQRSFEKKAPTKPDAVARETSKEDKVGIKT